MVSSFVWATVVPVAALVFGVGGIVAFAYRSSLTRYHVPAIVLTLLAVTAGLSTVGGVFWFQQQAHQVEYSVDDCGGPQATSVGEPARIAYDELSSDAKDVFQSALAADGEYTTTTDPDDFVYQDDTGTDLNYITYESECYAFHADPVSGFGVGLMIPYLIAGGTVATLLFLGFALGSLAIASNRRRS